MKGKWPKIAVKVIRPRKHMFDNWQTDENRTPIVITSGLWSIRSMSDLDVRFKQGFEAQANRSNAISREIDDKARNELELNKRRRFGNEFGKEKLLELKQSSCRIVLSWREKSSEMREWIRMPTKPDKVCLTSDSFVMLRSWSTWEYERASVVLDHRTLTFSANLNVRQRRREREIIITSKLITSWESLSTRSGEREFVEQGRMHSQTDGLSKLKLARGSWLEWRWNENVIQVGGDN
jgi:hypothetical protein